MASLLTGPVAGRAQAPPRRRRAAPRAGVHRGRSRQQLRGEGSADEVERGRDEAEGRYPPAPARGHPPPAGHDAIPCATRTRRTSPATWRACSFGSKPTQSPTPPRIRCSEACQRSQHSPQSRRWHAHPVAARGRRPAVRSSTRSTTSPFMSTSPLVLVGVSGRVSVRDRPERVVAFTLHLTRCGAPRSDSHEFKRGALFASSRHFQVARGSVCLPPPPAVPRKGVLIITRAPFATLCQADSRRNSRSESLRELHWAALARSAAPARGAQLSRSVMLAR